MKIIRSILVVAAVGVAGMSSAYAHDSFSIGLNFGAPAYYAAPPVRYYSAPPVVYAPPPAVYYSAPPVYYRPAPAAYFRYDGGRNWHHDRDDWGRGEWRGGHDRGWR